jgi:hypothetical protein
MTPADVREKEALIATMNPEWNDLAADWYETPVSS